MLLEPSLLQHLAFFPLCFGLPPLHHFVTRLSNSQAPLFTDTPSALRTFHTVVPLNGVSSVCPHSKNPKGNYRVVISICLWKWSLCSCYLPVMLQHHSYHHYFLSLPTVLTREQQTALMFNLNKLNTFVTLDQNARHESNHLSCASSMQILTMLPGKAITRKMQSDLSFSCLRAFNKGIR